jgi:putative ABC transport system permease protein
VRPLLLPALLRLISRPHLGAHRLRAALTTLGVAVGVITVVAIADVSESVLASFRAMVRTVAGDADLEITPTVGTLDERAVERAAQVVGVAATAGIVEKFVAVAGRRDETLLLLGIDFLGSRMWTSQFPRRALDIPDELVFLSQIDSVVLARAFAERSGLALDDEITIVSGDGPRRLRVRGILGDDAPASRLFGGAVALMDLPAAARLLGRDDRVDRVAVALAPTADTDAAAAALARLFGPGVAVGAPEGRGAQAAKLLFSLRTMLACMSFGAVLVGAFIVFQTVAVSVRERRHTFALLEAVGVGRRALVRLCLVETLVLAAAGVGLGVTAGHRLARLLTGATAHAASEIWVPVAATAHVGSGWGLVDAVTVGLGMALLAATLAIRSTFRTSTVAALRPAPLAGDERPLLLARAVAAAALLAATWLLALAPPGLGFAPLVGAIEAVQGATFAAAALLAPAVVVGAGLTLRALVRGSRSVPARLAAENLPRTPDYGGATVATIAAATGIAIMLAALVASHEAAWVDWLEQRFTADLIVGSGTHVRLLAGPAMSAEVGATIARVPGVASVEPFRVIEIDLDGQRAFLEGISIADRLVHGGLAMVEGDFAAAAPRLAAGTGVLLSDNLAFRLGMHRGDAITVPTPDGPRRFQVEGTFIDYLGSLDLGAVAVAQAQLATIWHDQRSNLWRVWLAPGTAAGTARAAILARLGPGAGYYVLTGRDFLEGVRAIVHDFFAAAWVLVIVAALVGVVGIVNAQAAAVVDRASQILTLRTIGVGRRDLTRSVLIECGVLGMLGGLCGVAVGTLLGAEIVLVALRLVTGYRMALVLPTGLMAAAVVAAALASGLAGWVPARAATRVGAGLRSAD